MHIPITHVVFEQATGAPQLPVASHVWTPLLRQRVAPGAQDPMQLPLAQACVPQSIGALHWPAETHTSTALAPGAQRLAPIVQGPPPSSPPSSSAS